jgi:hypothetical protein
MIWLRLLRNHDANLVLYLEYRLSRRCYHGLQRQFQYGWLLPELLWQYDCVLDVLQPSLKEVLSPGERRLERISTGK